MPPAPTSSSPLRARPRRAPRRPAESPDAISAPSRSVSAALEVRSGVNRRGRAGRRDRPLGSAGSGASGSGSGSSSRAGSFAKSSRSVSFIAVAAKRGGRMEERKQEHGAPAQLVDLRSSAHPRDPRLASAQELGREVSEARDDPRLDQRDLLPQVWLASLDLVRQRIAIARRARLEDVRDEDVIPAHPDLAQELREELAGAADERQALAVLLGPRRLADEHQVGVGVAGSEHRL